MRALSRVPLVMAAVGTVLAASPALAQTAPAGIVTAVHGTATIARAANSQAGPLRFKDDVFLHDRVTTGDRSLARILLGGRAVVTARERSTLTITAVPGAATLDLKSGRLLLAVAKGAMRPGESIDIKTRNAVIGIRGTVVVADFVPGAARDGSGDATVFTILRGAVEVTQIDPLAAHSVGTALRLGALESVKLVGAGFPEVTTISADQAKRMTQGFAVPVRLTPETSSKQVADMHAAQVERELTGLLAPAPTSGSSVSTSKPSLLTINDGRSQDSSVSTIANSGTSVVSGVTGTGTASGVVTGTVSGVTGVVTGVSGVTGALVGPTGVLTPTPAPTQTATSNPSSPQRNSGGLLGGLLKTTGSVLK